MGWTPVFTPDRNFVIAKAYFKANGYTILESLPYDKVAPVHSTKSFHYDEFTYKGVEHSRAFDLNWPGSASTERSMLKLGIPVLRSLGISFIYALEGRVGSAAQHVTHLHADQGTLSNQGRGDFKTKAGSTTVYDAQKICHMSTKAANNLDNTETVKRLNAVKMSSARHGKKHPYGVKYTQLVVGAPTTGKWDDASYEAHDKTVKALETLFKKDKLFTATPNTTWDAGTDAALVAFHKKY